MATAFQADAFQTVGLAFQIDIGAIVELESIHHPTVVSMVPRHVMEALGIPVSTVALATLRSATAVVVEPGAVPLDPRRIVEEDEQ